MMRSKQSLICVLVLLGMGFSNVCLANYNAARQLFQRQDYVRAAAMFHNAYQSPTSKAERAKAEWGLAESLSRLGLYYSASKYYSVIVRRGNKGDNPFFRPALEQLGVINSRVNLGQAHIVQLFKAKISPSDVPGPARGFYFYYLGVEAFNDRALEKAGSYFDKVPNGSPYYTPAMFHLGVIANLSGNHSRAISLFESVLSQTRGKDDMAEMREMTLMNIARVHYETKRFSEAISYYGQIPRDSEHWLDAIWETSWAFFFIQKFNNSLGQMHTLHSPFFENRFYPESYILQAITFLRLCRYDQVKESMKRFKDRYKPVFGEIKSMLSRYSGNPRGFFKLVYDYKTGDLRSYKKAEEIIKKLTLTDSFRGSLDTIRFSDREIEALGRYSAAWASSGLIDGLKEFLNQKKSAAISSSGRNMYNLATTFYSQLLELSNQTKLIVAEMQLGKLAKLRSKISAQGVQEKAQFIGGMQKLNIGQSLEYWPFEEEYWEDELGFYVYNMDSKCKAGDDEKDEKK